jgi:cytochrome c oxidase assembly protein subunit 15
MRALNLFAACLAFVVVIMGAYVRLSDAGLGCPDWPGCYGHPTPALATHEIAAAHSIDPLGPVSAAKAWKEMIHRYLAGTLGVAIFTLALLAWRTLPKGQRVLPSALVLLVIAQALLGMWTVTLQLKPIVVASHLLGGMCTLALLVWALPDRGPTVQPAYAKLRPQAVAVLILLAIQIALGGWVSANYAALACPDLPTCQGSFWPSMDVGDAFALDHLPGGLPIDALVAIHVMHRLGAVLVLAAGLWLARGLLAAPGLAGSGWTLLLALGVQVMLGVGNVMLSLPLPVAVAHNAGAAALLVVVILINARLRSSQP